MKKPILFTVGHSTRSFDEFSELLRAHGITEVVDVRTIPKSRRNPQFNEAALKKSLHREHIGYRLEKKLGGLRHTKKDSVNLGWRNTSFRGYADYMATPEFADGLDTLIKTAKAKKTAILCAEAVPWRCHRSLIADALTKRGWMVKDIMSRTSAPTHRLTSFLKIRKGLLVYPAPGKKTDTLF